jgi:hypothetical protein
MKNLFIKKIYRGGGGIKNCELKYDIIWYIIRTFVNATMYSQHNYKKKKLHHENPCSIPSSLQPKRHLNLL